MPRARLKVVQVANTLSSRDGGPARNCFELNLALNGKNDVEADLFWMQGSPMESLLASHDSNRFPLPVPGPRKIGWRQSSSGHRIISLWQAISVMRNADIVVIHGYYLWWIPIVAVYLKFASVPYVLTPHGSLTKRQMRFGALKKEVYEVVAGWMVRRWLGTFVTGSAIEAVEIKEQFLDARAIVGGVGTNLPRTFKSDDPVGSPLNLLCLSRIAPKKRIDLCIDAVAELVSTGVDVRLTIAGSGDSRLVQELQDRASSAGLNDFVDFVGEVQGVVKTGALLDADVFLLPSDDENFGIGLAEALAHGLPCVASDKVASAAEMQGRAGVTLSQPTGKTIAQAVVELMENRPEECQRDARATAERAFSWGAIANQWLVVLENVVSGGRLPGSREARTK